MIKPGLWGVIAPESYFWRHGRLSAAAIAAASDELLEHFGAVGWPLTFAQFCAGLREERWAS